MKTNTESSVLRSTSQSLKNPLANSTSPLKKRSSLNNKRGVF